MGNLRKQLPPENWNQAQKPRVGTTENWCSGLWEQSIGMLVLLPLCSEEKTLTSASPHSRTGIITWLILVLMSEHMWQVYFCKHWKDWKLVQILEWRGKQEGIEETQTKADSCRSEKIPSPSLCYGLPPMLLDGEEGQYYWRRCGLHSHKSQ